MDSFDTWAPESEWKAPDSTIHLLLALKKVDQATKERMFQKKKKIVQKPVLEWTPEEYEPEQEEEEDSEELSFDADFATRKTIPKTREILDVAEIPRGISFACEKHRRWKKRCDESCPDRRTASYNAVLRHQRKSKRIKTIQLK